MKKIEQSVELAFWNYSSEKELLKKLEKIGRTSYQSFGKITEESCFQFIKMIIDRKHFGIFEHEILSFDIVTNRGITHELVRHRMASFVQESTRYVGYNNKEFEYITDIVPDATSDAQSNDLVNGYMLQAYNIYCKLIELGVHRQLARDLLPHALKSSIFITANLREWLTVILPLRLDKSAHPTMRKLMKMILYEMNEIFPFLLGQFLRVYNIEL